MQSRVFIIILGAVALLAFVGCSDNNPLSPFQPEIVSNADNFAFQATGIKNVTTTLSYAWSNSGDSAKVNQDCSFTHGSAAVMLFDNNGAEVYSKSMVTNGDHFSSMGVPGNWTIRVMLSNFSGTLNFRVQKQ